MCVHDGFLCDNMVNPCCTEPRHTGFLDITTFFRVFRPVSRESISVWRVPWYDGPSWLSISFVIASVYCTYHAFHAGAGAAAWYGEAYTVRYELRVVAMVLCFASEYVLASRQKFSGEYSSHRWLFAFERSFFVVVKSMVWRRLGRINLHCMYVESVPGPSSLG